MPQSNLTRRRLMAGGVRLLPAAGFMSPHRIALGQSPGASPEDATPFRVAIPQSRLDRILAKLRNADWPDQPAGEPWAYGVDPAVLRDLVAYWTSAYDWRAQEALINRFPQFMARIDGHDIHFIHVRGSGRHPQPIIISHGWPSSFVEFMKIIGPLTRPEAFGGRAEDAFSVVIPSLPGFGFSSKPKTPIGTRAIARLFDQLMTRTLGYKDYIALGGDFGAGISCWLGYESPNCRAVQINFTISFSAPDAAFTTPEEQASLKRRQRFIETEGAYQAIQRTKPLTLAYGLTDSPLGAAAWIFEKYKTWSDLRDGDPWSVYTRDEILNNIMVYLVTGTLGTSTWMYAGGRSDNPIPPGARIEKPVGVAYYIHEPNAGYPRSYVEKTLNVVRWTDMQRGGHFGALEQPLAYAEEVHAFQRQIRR